MNLVLPGAPGLSPVDIIQPVESTGFALCIGHVVAISHKKVAKLGLVLSELAKLREANHI